MKCLTWYKISIYLKDQAACGVNVKVPDRLIAQKSACIIMQLKV